ncbi:hypothetical protein LOTGIDRAFT_162059 [Lottia gigantea]|uniref:Uncharacterized protein n=1 Tax=Lottia gigantea TaxID=225164 RepID=V4AI04_LOTGI|nr:hypothetical protein LOTGIDRAFT_162059 [Lottia gigantea]ESO93036.1 hypothetical protein LOTGIDRAFT_162059 [Lottia gigantea]
MKIRIPKNSTDSGRIDPSGVPKLLINPEFRARNLEMDVLSLAPDEQEEREFLASLSDQESTLGPDSDADLPHSPQKRLKSSADNNRPSYVKYFPETSTLQNTMKENVECQSSDVLSKLFGSSVNDDVQKVGPILDKSKSDTLSKSWRSQNPDRFTAYKEEYRSCFPVHELSEQFLNVPSLDDICEPMLRRKHATKSFKGWGSTRRLHSQPFKSIETLAYHGQVASKFGIISIAYLQQALGTFMNNFNNDKMTNDQAIASIKDMYEISTKAMDQMGDMAPSII